MKDCPYVGPRPFTATDQDMFKGRKAEAQELIALIHAHPIVLVYAPSGAGKTSLINAEVVPGLRKAGCRVFACGRVSGKLTPGFPAAPGKSIYEFNLLSTLVDSGDNSAPPPPTSLSEFVARYAQTPDSGLPTPIVLVIDQFEEIFTHYPERWQDRKQFFLDLAEAFASLRRLRVVLSMREEFIARLDPFADELPGRLRTRFRLCPLTPKGALEAIKEPAAARGVSFAEGVADKLVASLRGAPLSEEQQGSSPSEFVEPLHLQVVCRGIWEALADGTKVITESSIKTYGDVDQALARYYDDCVAQT